MVLVKPAPVPVVLDPIIIAENQQRLGDRLVDATGNDFNRASPGSSRDPFGAGC
jgi:hypothetical protein